MRTQSSRRSAWIDAARGIGIILVVVAHAERGIIRAGMTAATPLSFAIDGTIYAFHMPLFFLLAGLHVGRGLRAGRPAFMRDKLVTIVWPYFLWSVIYILLNVAVGAVNDPLGLANILSLPWHPVAHFWFLYALFLCHVVAVLLWPNRWLLAVATIVLALTWLTFGMINIVFQMGQMFPFFAIGLLAGPAITGDGERLRRAAPMLVAGGFLLLALSRLAMSEPALPPWVFACCYYLGAIGGISGVIGLSLVLGERLGWLRRIGQASMAIFVVHTFFAAGLRISVMQLGLGVDHLLLLGLSSLFAIVCPWLLYEIAGRYGLNTVLGLGKFVRA